MKKFLFAVGSSLFLIIGCHVQKKSSEVISKTTDIENNSAEISWPKDVDSLIEHLNSWNKNELEVYERPDIAPKQLTSGETNAWIEKHKKLLKELGAITIWNKEKKKYELKKD